MLRSSFGLKKIKVGHAGTLDPLASGLMIICTGKSTKMIDSFRDLDKEYVARFRLGMTTPSFDLETETDGIFPTEHITANLVKEALEKFKGRQDQMPPAYSAKLIDGKRSYEYARKGIHKELLPVEVFFRELELLSFQMPDVKVRILCSKGTYIRSFARDLGVALGSGAYLSELERTAIGHFRVEDSYTPETFQEYINHIQQTDN